MNDNYIKSKSIPGISACMIVRNEEKFIAQCLRSIQEYVDEIIIVDTGSQDKTVEIAKSFGARIYSHPWEDHFSKHRNQSFGYAKMDWILYIDADEELLSGSGELLRKSVTEAENEVDAIAVTLECIFNKGLSMAYNNAVRLFRNHRGFYYRGRVHNYIVGIKKVICRPIRLFHHGYNLDKTSMARKFDRTTKLLKLDIVDNPDDPRPHHFLSASYLSENMYEEALKESLMAITLSEKKNEYSQNYLWSIYIAASSCLYLGKLEKARELAEKGTRLFSDHLDSYYILSIIAYEKHDRTLFDKYFNKYLKVKENYQKNPEKFGEIVNNTLGSQWSLHLLNAFLIMDEGPDEYATHEIESAINLCPDTHQLYMRMGNYYLSKNRLSEAENNFLKAEKTKPEDLQAKKLLASVYELAGKDTEQKEFLEKALKVDSSDIECLFSLGLLQMKENEPEEALSCFEAISTKTDDIRVTINKAICLREMGRFQEVKSFLSGLECEDDSLNKVILSNLAFSFLATSDRLKAIEVVQRLENLDYLNPYPPILLSRVYLEKLDIESCVRECSKLLYLLGVKEDRELNSIEDLAQCFLHAARVLRDTNRPRHYIQECFELSLRLAENTPSLMADIGAVFINVGLLKTGTKILKKALLKAPSDKLLRDQITAILQL